MDAIMTIARKYSLWVIEDCAQAHLARYKGRLVGTFGNAATFSFYPGKNLGAYGDAGCIVTADDRLADWMATFARHGGKGEHVIEGINSRLDGLQAAILGAKLPHLPIWTEARRRVAKWYEKLLGGIGDILLRQSASGETTFIIFMWLAGRGGCPEEVLRECRDRNGSELSEGSAILRSLLLSQC